MKSHLQANKQLPISQTSRKLNSQNGNDSEILTASHIINAFNAEVRWGSRNEDNSKVDLFLSYEHPWNKAERIILLVQVKSGKSYGSVSDDRFKLKKRAFKEVKRNLTNICLIWLDNEKGKSYWAYIHPNSKTNLTQYGKNHLITPAIRYEIARCIARNHTFNKKGGRGIIINTKTNETDLKLLRCNTRTKYKKYKDVINPLFGKIEFTNLGWNHMFRAARKKIYKEQSLKVIPYLKQILLQQPDKHWINNFDDSYKRKDFIFYRYEYVLRYENIKTNNNEKKNIVIKIREEIGFPILWMTEPHLSQKIIRKVVFKSCSLK